MERDVVDLVDDDDGSSNDSADEEPGATNLIKLLSIDPNQLMMEISSMQQFNQANVVIQLLSQKFGRMKQKMNFLEQVRSWDFEAETISEMLIVAQRCQYVRHKSKSKSTHSQSEFQDDGIDDRSPFTSPIQLMPDTTTIVVP
eukprot:TRINITY_DN8667_c0_g1_i2.p1 TRINITY_DN8667_c0_g1~~TRINITY_DN8667_c0_g1_i2.p1  ORF type:complete len:143 (-),score=27.94 TRINITY_DN8667_c0_g1_i2:188-616(-)